MLLKKIYQFLTKLQSQSGFDSFGAEQNRLWLAEQQQQDLLRTQRETLRFQETCNQMAEEANRVHQDAVRDAEAFHSAESQAAFMHNNMQDAAWFTASRPMDFSPTNFGGMNGMF